ncbi:outer membrane protein assembly factor BamB family protein [Halovulum sp. GXIMD14793]
MMYLFPNRLRVVALVALSLTACSEREVILPGEREPIRPVEATQETTGEVPNIAIPAARRNANWTHLQGNQTHMLGNVVLSASPSRRWSASIGAGSGRRTRITAAPIVADGRIFTLDASANVAAVSTAGRVLWTTGVTREGERAPEGFGGGLAYDAGALIATTGFGEVLRLDPTSGEILWRQSVDATIRSAPAVADDRVVVVARNDIAYGLDLETGALDWRVQGAGLGAGLLGGASPAIRGPVAVIPFQSGEVVAVLTRSGRRVWSAAITGGRRELVRSNIKDISGDPVVDFDLVYAASQSGRLVQLDRRSGERLWTHRDGAYSPAVPVGGSVFIVSDIGQLVRIDAETGQAIWRTDLPEWTNPSRKREAIPHFGPILAGGRLWVASGDGKLRSFDPRTGKAAGEVDLPGGAASLPAVADGVMYIVSRNGSLHAFQ